MNGPSSSYSCLEIHICWNVLRLARIEPPIQTEYFLSGGAITLIFMVGGASVVISFCIRSAIPGYMVVPPESTELAYRSLRMSTSHFMIELYVVSCMPQDSMPKKLGWNIASGQRKRSLPIVMTWNRIITRYTFSSTDRAGQAIHDELTFAGRERAWLMLMSVLPPPLSSLITLRYHLQVTLIFI